MPPVAQACVFCGSAVAVRLYGITTNQGESYGFERCSNCQAVYLVPSPSPIRLAEAYSEDYFGHRQTKFLPWLESVAEGYRRLRSRRVIRVVPPGGRVLDVGCGNGQFLRSIAESGIEAHGLEIPGKAAERAAQVPGIELFVGRLAEAPYTGGSFDAVTLWHVLEHLPNPRATLQAIEGLLKPSGYLFVSLPNIDSWQSRIFKGRWLHHDPPRHLCYLGAQDLELQLRKLSLRPVRRSFYSIEQNPFGFQQSLLNTIQPKRDVLYQALKGDKRVYDEHGRLAVWLQLGFFAVTFPMFAALSVLESAMGRGGTMELVFKKQSSEP